MPDPTPSEQDRHAWERPGCHEVAPGIYRIPLPLPNDGLKAVNVYAVVDGDHLVLVDSGWSLAESQQLLTDSLATIGFGLRDVRDFLVTHVHRDHYTQAVAIRRTFGNRVSLGEGEQATLRAMHVETVHPDAVRLRAAGAPRLADFVSGWTFSDRVDWEDPDVWLADGIEIPLATRTLRAINTPGHTRGHLVYLDAEHQVLFAGDHVLPHITPSIGTEWARPASPLRDYLASLELVRALPDTRLLPAHGPVTDSVHDRVDELLAHHAKRLDATAAAVDTGASTGFEVAMQLPWTRREHRLDTMDDFNQILAVMETVAHLDVLVERGWLTRTTVDGTVHYSRA